MGIPQGLSLHSFSERSRLCFWCSSRSTRAPVFSHPARFSERSHGMLGIPLFRLDALNLQQKADSFFRLLELALESFLIKPTLPPIRLATAAATNVPEKPIQAAKTSGSIKPPSNPLHAGRVLLMMSVSKDPTRLAVLSIHGASRAIASSFAQPLTATSADKVQAFALRSTRLRTWPEPADAPLVQRPDSARDL